MSFFNSLGGNQPQGNGFMNLMNQFKKFQSIFSGDANQQAQQLLNSGKVTQQQYNQAVQMAKQFQQMFGGKKP